MSGSPLDKLSGRRILLPIAIGLIVVAWLVWREFDVRIFDNIHFTWGTILWLLAACLFMAGRDAGYMFRIRTLSRGELSWRQAFRVIMLWEFTSAVTPSVVGGTSVATLYIHKEGLGLGRSTAIVLLTSLLDELYFVAMFPLLLLVVGRGALFDVATSGNTLTQGIMAFILAGYFMKLTWVLLLAYGLFVNPSGLKWLLDRVFRLPLLRRWRNGAGRVGDEIVESSVEIRRSGVMFWLKASAATFLSWSSRYMVANALIMAFFSVGNQLLLFARQLSMWIMMLVMPTPGGSGLAELVFTEYCSDLIALPVEMQAAAAMLIALLWRMVTYYPYLIVGALLFPRWLGRNFRRRKR
ncbi:MAG: flippase-like domain-containing protein [Rikenellaceae bacterium]|jgi:uncharacterized protein (TIRG00374 family)|nr:flippase-like domain-containing protein [Rikenellaceae bacterium]